MDDQGKRLILALAISFGFIFLWQMVFQPPPAPEVEAPPPAETAVTPPAASTSLISPAVSSSGPAPEGGPAPALSAAEERLVAVETPLYSAVLTNRGGAIKSLRLKRFREDAKDPSSWVQMVRMAKEGTPLPLAAEITTAGGSAGLSQALFQVEGADLSLEGEEGGRVTFRHRSADGLEFERTLEFSALSYAIGVEQRVINRGTSPYGGRMDLTWAAGLEPPPGVKPDRSFSTSKYGYSGAVVLREGKTVKIKPKKLEGTQVMEAPPQWVSSQDMYFIAALLPGPGIGGGLARKASDGRVEVGLSAPIQLAPGTAATVSARAYVGPKETGALRSADPSLEAGIELGWFGFIARPLLKLLNFFYRYVGNYGVAIIILTILIKVLFIPFTNLGHRSMKKMQEIQPQINAMRDRYKKDREKLNVEIMNLYKANKVNPAGGCLPILAQIPVFFALYRALLGAIELRHAPFALWITDLSAKDPWFITPIVMGGTMFVQQKMTPTSMDPKQAQIMLFLPIVFTAMFLSFPSGLVLYWLVNNVLTIGHQYLLNRADERRAAAAEPAPRPRKGRN